MLVKFPFGREKVELTLPDSTSVLESKAVEYVPKGSQEELVQEALEHLSGVRASASSQRARRTL